MHVNWSAQRLPSNFVEKVLIGTWWWTRVHVNELISYLSFLYGLLAYGGQPSAERQERWLKKRGTEHGGHTAHAVRAPTG